MRADASVEAARNVPPRDEWIAPEKYGNTVDEYLANGKRDTQIMLDLVADCGHSVEKLGHIFELGCADGRMLRWLEPLAADVEIWGSDLDAHRILWCKQHLSPPFRFLTNTIVPHTCPSKIENSDSFSPARCSATSTIWPTPGSRSSTASFDPVAFSSSRFT